MQAMPRSRTAALQLAAAFLAERHAAARSAEPAPEPTLTEAASPFSGLYVFNVGSDEGFVIVGGDDRLEAVLGYVDNGSFDAASMPENIRAWLAGLAGLAGLDGQSAQVLNYVHQTTTIRPLLTTQWSQLAPYNTYCPDGSPTGCVATAMAQVMDYYQWPQSATATIPAYGAYAALPPMLFDWTAMAAGYGGDEPASAAETVAQLMLYCGHSVQMKYGVSSTAFHEAIPQAMCSFFDYDCGARCVYRSDFSVAEWEALICDELQAGRPVIYAGERSGGGHEFVCDGYDGDGFFHINWGWGGYSDGWYRLTALQPPYVGTGGGTGLGGYTMYHAAVIGLQPNCGGEAVATVPLLTAEELHVVSTPVSERSSADKPFQLRIRCPMANHTRDSLKSNFGLALMQDGQLVAGSEVLASTLVFAPGSSAYRGIQQKFSFGAGLTGSYRIVPVCKVTRGKSAVLQPALGADTYYIDVELTETTLTMTEHPRRDLAVGDVQFRFIDDMIEATATVDNHGDDFGGLLYLFVGGYRVACNGVNIDAGESNVVRFRYQQLLPGKSYAIGYTTDGGDWLAEGPATYTTENTSGTFTVWYADGQSEHLAYDAGNVATVPPGVLAVDFGSSEPATIVPNGNPNCLYYVAAATAATAGLGNVVTGRYAPLLTLHDGHDFYCPMAFTAGSAVYRRTFARG